MPAPADVEPLLRVADLDIAVAGGAQQAVHKISFDVHKGQTIGLVGESGSGKTLTCRAVLGVLPPGCAVTGGVIRFSGRDLVGADRRDLADIRSRYIGAVFQDPASYLNPSLTIGRQLAEVLHVKSGLPRKAAHTRAGELLELVGMRRIEQVLKQYPHQLSGGMLQRALLAIAVSCDPELLIADEATTALDVTVQAEVIDLLRSLRAELGLSMVFVSHDLAVVSELCDHIVVLYAGEIVEAGPTRRVLTQPRHHYTTALLDVADTGDWDHPRLKVIPGQPPPLNNSRTGCSFADRCTMAQSPCRDHRIPIETAGDDAVRCLYPTPLRDAS